MDQNYLYKCEVCQMVIALIKEEPFTTIIEICQVCKEIREFFYLGELK